ncbi:hypothetical protein MBLNU459_g6177t1 [Dothideomycetes sp. NU459]
MSTNASHDPFDTLLSLEDQYYNEGYELGVADGSRAGRIEGRVFGLEKGFEKFAAMGNLAGRCAVWDARLPDQTNPPEPLSDKRSIQEDDCTLVIPPLVANPRLQKHLQTLSALTEAESLSTENNEDSVSDFDDRLKRAEGKIKVIEKIVGEGPLVLDQPLGLNSDGSQSKRQVRVRRNEVGESSMEDFNIPHARS